MTIAQAIKRLRKSLGKNQIEFAEMLGCQQNTVSRYELGKLVPGPIILMRMAEAAKDAGMAEGEEASTIRLVLQQQFDSGLFGGRPTLEQMIESMRPLLSEMQLSDAILDTVPAEKRKNFGFRQFVPAVAHIIETCDTVDQSVSDILALWAAHAGREGTAGFFRDALGFLRARLWPAGPRLQDPAPSPAPPDSASAPKQPSYKGPRPEPPKAGTGD